MYNAGDIPRYRDCGVMRMCGKWASHIILQQFRVFDGIRKEIGENRGSTMVIFLGFIVFSHIYIEIVRLLIM